LRARCLPRPLFLAYCFQVMFFASNPSRSDRLPQAAGRSRADGLRCRQCQHAMAGRARPQDAHAAGRAPAMDDHRRHHPEHAVWRLTDTLEDAKRDLATAWRRWRRLARTRKRIGISTEGRRKA